jgi:EmrB/QacA subfamily drug resistance transporter
MSAGSGDRRWLVLLVLSGALALISLDNTIVNVALPRLQEDLGATTAQLQWVVDAYSVLFAGSLLLAGSLGDRFGRRRMLLSGLVVFMAGSLGAAMMTDVNGLTACRAVMGVGAAFIMPSTLSILVQVFAEPRERAKAIGVWAAVAGVGVAIGPIIGGLLLERFNWQAIFWVNPPLALAAIIATLLLVPESLDASRPRLDIRGAMLSSAGLIALVLTVIDLPDSGVSIGTLSTGLAAMALLAGFVWWERRAPRPLLPMNLFGNRLFVISVICVGVVYFALMGAMFFLPQFLQLVQGMTPLESGLCVLPGAGGLLLASLFSAGLAERIGSRRTVVAGLSLVTAGLVSMSFLSASSPYPFIGVSLGLMGIGLGLTLPQATNGVLSTVPRERSGMGSAVNDSIGELGGSFGVAVLGALLSVTYRDTIEKAISGAGDVVNEVPAPALDAVRESLASASLAIARLPQEVIAPAQQAAGEAFVTGMGWALLAGALITLGGSVLAWRWFPDSVAPTAE